MSGRIFTAGVTWAGLTYSLNIANAADQRTEVVSRPTLMTFLKKESRFFSGTELVNVAGGNYGSNLSRYQIGVSVAVTPATLVGDVVTLNIGVETSNLQSPNPNLLQTVDVGKTRVETTARMRLGETILLGGIYERDEIQKKIGFPGLRDVPFLQYFFANESTVSSRRSIAVLLTPRSPDTVKSAVNRAMTRESVRPHFSELVSRNPDWFHPETNAINIFSYINLDPVLYYEFRTGDILPPSWSYEPALQDKLAELSSFLYF
jgi:general secretion pathway protein D